MNTGLLTLVLLIQLEGWELLESVRFKNVFNEDLAAYVDIPKFGKDLQAIDGQKIKIKGHVLPLDINDSKTLILSKYPYASCFFCGGAGLESVIEVHFDGPVKRFKPDEVITVTGKLKLNQELEHLVFILEEAQWLVWEDR